MTLFNLAKDCSLKYELAIPYIENDGGRYANEATGDISIEYHEWCNSNFGPNDLSQFRDSAYVERMGEQCIMRSQKGEGHIFTKRLEQYILHG